MNLPAEVEKVLKENIKFCFDSDFSVTTDDSNWFRENLGLKKTSSSFISYYTIVAFPPVGNGAELMPLESILENAKDDMDELPKGIGSRFLRLTSFEGEGAYYFDVETDKVYDADWGEELEMTNGNIPALSDSFFEFLQSYYAKT